MHLFRCVPIPLENDLQLFNFGWQGTVFNELKIFEISYNIHLLAHDKI